MTHSLRCVCIWLFEQSGNKYPEPEIFIVSKPTGVVRTRNLDCCSRNRSHNTLSWTYFSELCLKTVDVITCTISEKRHTLRMCSFCSEVDSRRVIQFLHVVRGSPPSALCQGATNETSAVSENQVVRRKERRTGSEATSRSPC